MARDHTFANNWLMGPAKEVPGIPHPMLTANDKALHQKLEGLGGEQFDRRYLGDMVQDHEKTVGMFETEARDGQNQRVKDCAEALLPMLRQHLAEARKLSSSSGIAGNMSAHGTETSGSSMPQRQ